jgi:hypothetical protein
LSPSLALPDADKTQALARLYAEGASPSYAGGAQFRMLESGDVEYQITLDVPRRGRLARR